MSELGFCYGCNINLSHLLLHLCLDLTLVSVVFISSSDQRPLVTAVIQHVLLLCGVRVGVHGELTFMLHAWHCILSAHEQKPSFLNDYCQLYWIYVAYQLSNIYVSTFRRWCCFFTLTKLINLWKYSNLIDTEISERLWY